VCQRIVTDKNNLKIIKETKDKKTTKKRVCVICVEKYYLVLNQ
jgi:hypothetical protein